MHIRRITAIIALAATGAAGAAASTADPASATTMGEVLRLDRTSSTSGTALVVCNTDTADRAWSVRTYEVTLDSYSYDELTAIGDALASGTETLGLRVAWNHEIVSIGDATGAVQTTARVYLNGVAIGRDRVGDHGEQDTEIVLTPASGGQAVSNGDTITVVIRSRATAWCLDGSTSVFDQAYAVGKADTLDGGTVTIAY